MMRTWKLVGLKTLVVVLIAAGPAVAGGGSDAPASTEKRLDDIQKQLNTITKALSEINKALPGLDNIQKQLDDLKTECNLRLDKAQTQIADLKEQVAQLRIEIDRLRTRPAQVQVQRNTTGRVEIQNAYSTEMAVVVNNKSYRVPPGQTIFTEPIPEGPFTYEVLNVTEPRHRTMTANTIYPIRIHPVQ
jgi:septal ring factor EnvC (AmiA/AmiB activator)